MTMGAGQRLKFGQDHQIVAVDDFVGGSSEVRRAGGRRWPAGHHAHPVALCPQPGRIGAE